MDKFSDIDKWLESIAEGDRQALSKAITLVESKKQEDRRRAHFLLSRLYFKSKPSLRIGITGPPGAGKSSLIESLGLLCIDKGYSVAVLSIDPSSAISKGSILGDKTRMASLGLHEKAFIRPSPSGDYLGGIAQNTRESIFLCESAGYDYIFVETAGIGQTEYQVSTMTDLTLLVLIPGAGDELQGIKKGIMEWADIMVLNKADEKKDPRVVQSFRDLLAASHLFSEKTPGWNVKIMMTSALSGAGIPALFEQIIEFQMHVHRQGQFTQRRERQMINYFHDLVNRKFWDKMEQQSGLKAAKQSLEERIKSREISPEEAAELALSFIFAT